MTTKDNQEIERKMEQNALARDVRTLGNALGAVLIEQGGQPLFDRVERLRNLAKARRAAAGVADIEQADCEAFENADREMDSTVSQMDYAQMVPVLKAFTTYFQLVN